MGNCSELYTYEKSYTLKILKGREVKQAYALRHKVFAEELNWVKASTNRMDIDQYDRGAFLIGVLSPNNQICGCFRIIPYDNQFMLENDFHFLLNKKNIIRKRQDTVEISRFCIDFNHRLDYVKFPVATSKVALLLYKGMYQWCCLQNVRFSYAVVETKFLRRLNLSCLPFYPIDDARVMPDGTEAVAVIIDWREFEIANMKRNISLLKWFNEWENTSLIQQSMPHLRKNESSSYFKNLSIFLGEQSQLNNILRNSDCNRL